MGPKKVNMEEDNSSSRAVRTERTILSPFTKEYRVLAADSGIRLFLEGSLRQNESPNNSSMKGLAEPRFTLSRTRAFSMRYEICLGIESHSKSLENIDTAKRLAVSTVTNCSRVKYLERTVQQNMYPESLAMQLQVLCDINKQHKVWRSAVAA
ncbi:hypothetical protein NC653_030561 [Populus alba x Populus x berolinensis]|uniref:Uncharacterized protein n=1 Tax=Populus alba x Populus x berolinensis TaxID=444605 RepID=A0AAD6Q0J2_9ROSI|nr:hypothetical protein NC653_030561 [Populus alba x Populus x berolinensis]